MQNDEFAAKAAGHDLRGLVHLFEVMQHNNRIHFPLQALIDYRGFRLIAMTLLPLSKEQVTQKDENGTLIQVEKVQHPVMGTNNGGADVYADEIELLDAVEEAARRLQLCEHEVKGVKLWLGADVEGHIGEDGLYYLLDFARVFPAEHPWYTPHLPVCEGHKSIFWRLLRYCLIYEY